MEKEWDYQNVFGEDDPDMAFLKSAGGGIARLKEVMITNITLPRIYERMPKVVLYETDVQKALNWQPYVVIGTNKMFTYQGFLKAPQGIVVYGSQIFEELKVQILAGRVRANRYHRNPSMKLFLLEVPEFVVNHFLETDFRDSELYCQVIFQMMKHCKEDYWKSCEADILRVVNRCVYGSRGADVEIINFRLNEKLALDHVNKATFEPRDAILLLACQQPELVNEVFRYARMNEEHVHRITRDSFNNITEYPSVVPPFARLIRRFLPVDIIAGFKVFNTRLRLDEPHEQIREMIRAARTLREATGEPIDILRHINFGNYRVE